MILFVFIALLVSLPANAQTNDLFRVGITGSVSMNMHRGTLTTADGLLECGTFEDANTLSWMAGNALWLPVTNNIAFNARLQYWKADGTFSAPNDVSPNVALPDGSLVRMSSEYEVVTTLDYINLDLLALWYPIHNFYVGLGPQLGFNTRANFEQKETILEPSFLEFTQGGRERTFLASSFEQNGSTAVLRIAAHAVVGYDFRVNNNVVVSPELGYAYAFTNVLNTSEWAVHAARAGVTVSWAFLPTPEPEPLVIQPEQRIVEVPKPVRSMRMDVQSVMNDGTRLAGADILITEHRASDVVPLLPFVFFESGSSAIPSRYHAFHSTAFDEASIQDSILGVYHELLNIIGSRLRKYPGATITIAGYREPADGESDAALSQNRATTVKQYLVQNWSIASERINITTGTLPPVVSNRNVADGRIENRRAEISSDDQRILAPVTLTSIRRNAEPKSIRVAPVFTTPDDVASATVELQLGSTALAGPLHAAANGAEWRVDVDAVARALGLRNMGTGTVRASATYSDGETTSQDGLLSARRIVQSTRFSNEVINDSTIERFRLIFFDFDKPTVSDFNKPTIDLIRSRIRTNSSVRVTGLTDRTGSVEYNTDLSRRRAEAIEATIKQRVVPNKSVAVGGGPMLIYNNDLPEGRWYNRTVLIEVATPVEEQ